MQRIIVILLLAFASAPARADLDDTMQESVLKYGPASATGSPLILMYVHAPYRIWQTYDASGHCAIAEFSPLDRAATFTRAQCAELDRNNLPPRLKLGDGPGWEVVPWTGGVRNRHPLSYQYTGADGTLFQAIVGQSRDDENSPWYDDRIYLNAAGIKVFKSSGKAQATQAPADYRDDYNVQHLKLSNGEWVVSYTSSLDGQWYHITEAQYAQAQAEGVKLGRYLANRAAQGLAPQSLDESRVMVAGDGMKIFGRDTHYVKFYIDTAIERGSNELKRLNALLAARGTRLNNTDASVAMDRLQDAKGLPRVTGGVWYDVAADTYNWIGPKFGRPMSEPAVQFLREVAIANLSYPPSVTQLETDIALKNAERIEAEVKAKAAAGPTEAEKV